MSNINFLSINENFPVAGQDNDTQVFRDNFDSIKTALSVARTEITDLEDNTARTDQPTDFNYNILNSVTLQDTYLRTKDYGSPISVISQEISFKQALYHIIKFSNNCALSFIEFPTPELGEDRLGQLGKATLELYGDGSARTLTFTTTGSTVIKKSSNFPGTLTVTSTTNPIIIEVWQYSTDAIFLNYVGSFS